MEIFDDDFAGLPVVPDSSGVPRVLAALPPYSDYGGLPKFMARPTATNLPRSAWREIDLAPLPVPVLDQGQHGSCVGHGSTSAYWFAYLIAGGTVPPSGFSPTSLYALINGGRDGGAVVSDAMQALIDDGLCLMSEVPESVIYERQIPTSAKETRKRFRVSDAFHTESFDSIASAVILGFAVSFGITIRSGFNAPGVDGLIAPGGYILGGHCMCACGLKHLGDGRWALKVRNSWGTRWGAGGNCLLTEEHFPGVTDAFAIRTPEPDPQDPHPAPIAVR